jgi:hypothetical protein
LGALLIVPDTGIGKFAVQFFDAVFMDGFLKENL